MERTREIMMHTLEFFGNICVGKPDLKQKSFKLEESDKI